MQYGQSNLDNAHYQIIQTDGSSTQNLVYVKRANTNVWSQKGTNVVSATENNGNKKVEISLKTLHV